MGTQDSKLKAVCKEYSTYDSFVKWCIQDYQIHCPYCNISYPSGKCNVFGTIYKYITHIHYHQCPTLLRIWREVQGAKTSIHTTVDYKNLEDKYNALQKKYEALQHQFDLKNTAPIPSAPKEGEL